MSPADVDATAIRRVRRKDFEGASWPGSFCRLAYRGKGVRMLNVDI